MSRVSGYLTTADGSTADLDADRARRLLRDGTLFWLDLDRPTDSELGLLRQVFGIHPLAADDAAQFGQRPKLVEFDGFVQVVAYGARGMGDLVEVHCFCAEHYLVTIRREDCPAVTGLRTRLGRRTAGPATPVVLLYLLLSGLADSFFPVLSGFDDRIDQLQDQIFEQPTQQQLSELFTMKRWLIGVRKVVTPQRDMVASVASGITELPGMTPDAQRYYRDLYDQLIRISDLVDSYRDLLTSSMDAHLSMVSQRLDSVMKQLTVIATIVLPLSFLTGFFGQNFAWLVGHISGLPAFLGAGIGVEIVAMAVMLVLFRRRGLL